MTEDQPGTYVPLRYDGGKTYFVRMESYKAPGFFQRLSRLFTQFFINRSI